jgi:WD40 repeat protein
MLLQTLDFSFSYVTTVVWSPDGSNIAMGYGDGRAAIWDVATGALLQTLSGHTNGVHWVAWSPDGESLATASWDNSANIWDVSTGQVLQSLIGHTNSVHCINWSPDGTRVVTASADGTAMIWDMGSPTSDTPETNPYDKGHLPASAGWSMSEIYPNPTTTSVMMKIGAAENRQVSVRLISAIGQEKMRRDGILLHAGINAIELPLSPTVPNGAYQLIVGSPEGQSATTLIIQR